MSVLFKLGDAKFSDFGPAILTNCSSLIMRFENNYIPCLKYGAIQLDIPATAEEM